MKTSIVIMGGGPAGLAAAIAAKEAGVDDAITIVQGNMKALEETDEESVVSGDSNRLAFVLLL